MIEVRVNQVGCIPGDQRPIGDSKGIWKDYALDAKGVTVKLRASGLILAGF